MVTLGAQLGVGFARFFLSLEPVRSFLSIVVSFCSLHCTVNYLEFWASFWVGCF